MPDVPPDLRTRFTAERPGAFFLDADDPGALTDYLRDRGLLRPSGLLRRRPAVARAERLGGGNMNCVVRAHLDRDAGTLVVKQARPWVERYPSIAAPPERARAEARYLGLVGHVDALAAAGPTLLHHDGGDHILVLADLGPAPDLASLYAAPDRWRRPLAGGTALLDALTRYLATLHGHFARHPPARPVANVAMRALNHEHVFDLPFRRGNGLDLDGYAPGLAAAFAEVNDDALRARAAELGEVYLRVGAAGTLLHGDFYPGSFVLAAAPDGGEAVAVIDPEFCFTGPPEWDVGVLVAHLHLSGRGDLVDEALAAYGRPLDADLWRGFAGVEILRRVAGVAQLPLGGTADRARLLATGRALALGTSESAA